jgi:acetyl-CoA carboxylase carboxyl transferase subunit alpha
MARLRVPILVIVIGEGGSGGALAIAVGDRVLMLENSVYSVISPEGCASILWKDASRAPEAAAAMKVTAPDLLGFGIIDRIIPEPLGGAHRDPAAMTETLRLVIGEALDELCAIPVDRLLEERLQKYLRMGVYAESA